MRIRLGILLCTLQNSWSNCFKTGPQYAHKHCLVSYPYYPWIARWCNQDETHSKIKSFSTGGYKTRGFNYSMMPTTEYAKRTRRKPDTHIPLIGAPWYATTLHQSSSPGYHLEMGKSKIWKKIKITSSSFHTEAHLRGKHNVMLHAGKMIHYK